MANFIVQHRKNDSVIYESVDQAKQSIKSLDGVDGEIAIARYNDEDEVRSVIGVCKKTGDSSTWTIFSHDDSMLDRMIPSDGNEGQILTRTDNGAKWSNNVNFWKGTLTEYVAIDKKDPDCIYFIVENDINTTSD